MSAPIIEPIILLTKVLDKYLDNKPITNTLPQVKNTVLCKPINKSVTAKLARTIGKDLKPKKAGT